MQFAGLIIKGYSGFYYVLEEQKQGSSAKTIWECSLRGKLRLTAQDFFPGDRVLCTKTDPQKGQAVLEKVYPRQNELGRPAVANVTQVVIVTALAQPAPDFLLLDKLIVLARSQGIAPLLCFNKADLVSPAVMEAVRRKYEPTGYSLVLGSILENWGFQELEPLLQHQISVLAGPSGVGKTSLLNSLLTGAGRPTGAVSKKAGRGRHTTRFVQLLPLAEGGLLADTPGFSRLYLPAGLKRADLRDYYPDFAPWQTACKFKTCLHDQEPACQVREAVDRGALDAERYGHYRQILAEVIREERSY